MTQHSELALVLDIASYRETSSLVRVFTEHEGRISLIARGLRSQKDTHGAAALQPFNLVNVRFSLKDGATIGNLISVDIEQAAEATRSSIEAYALVSFWFEILKVTSQERAALNEIFHVTRNMLESQRTAPGLTFEFLQQLSGLVAGLGFALTWDRCTVCGRQLPLNASSLPHWFSVPRGGIVCQACAENEAAMPLNAEEGQLIRGLIAPELARANEGTGASLIPLLNLVHRFLVHHLEQPLKTIKFVNETV